MKKWMIFVLTAALVLCLAACGGEADKPAEDTTTTTTTVAEDVTDSTTTGESASATKTTTEFTYDEDENAFNDVELNWG